MRPSSGVCAGNEDVGMCVCKCVSCGLLIPQSFLRALTLSRNLPFHQTSFSAGRLAGR